MKAVSLLRKNLRKTVSNYALYFVTLVLSSMLFFAFLSLTSRYNPLLKEEGVLAFSLFYDTIRYAVLTISIIFAALVHYINTYMLKRRSREFSIYMILGMDRRTVAGQFFKETIVFGLIAVLLGCGAGTVFSGVLTSFVRQMLFGEAFFQLGLYPDTALTTLLFFCVVFALAGLLDIHTICKTRLLDLLHAVQAHEGRRKKQSGLPSLLTALVCFAIDGAALVGFAQMSGIYAGDIPPELSNRYQTAAVAAAIIGIFCMYRGLLFLLSRLRRTSWKSHGLNAVLLGNLFQKISGTARVLSAATLAVTISLTVFVILPVLAEISAGYLEYRMPYDLMINNTYRYIDRIEDIPEIDFSFVGNILAEHGITIQEDVSQKSYFLHKDTFRPPAERENWNDLPTLAVKLSDYNKMRHMAGLAPILLSADEFTLHISYELDVESVPSGIRTREITLDDGTQLHLTQPEIHQERLGTYLFHSAGVAVILPDTACRKLQLARTCYYANTAEEIPFTVCDTIRNEIESKFRSRYAMLFERYETKYQEDSHYTSFIDPIRFLTQERSVTEATNVSIRLLGIYIGVIFFLICMTVLALHLVTDVTDHRDQYRILHQLGVGQESLFQLIRKQSACGFFVPCAAAFGIALLIITSFALRFGQKVYAYVGSVGFRFGILIPGVLIVSILVCYYSAAMFIIDRELFRILHK